MRKFLVSAVLLASAVSVSAPAAAQWAPPQPQGYAYGYNNYGQIRRLEVRVQQIRNQIRQLDRRNVLSNREAQSLEYEARSLQSRIRQLGYNGLNGRERYDVERRIARLEQRVYREARDGNRYNGYGNNGYYDNRDGWNNRDNWRDRDRDGRNDRYEDDQGQDHDG